MNINIDKYMPNEKTTATVCGKEYEVNDDYRSVIKFSNMQQDIDSPEKLEEALAVAVGKDAAKEIMANKLSFTAFKHIVIGLLAAMTGENMAVLEKRVGEQFRKSKSK